MKSLLLWCFITCSTSLFAQLQSSYLKDPDLAKNMVLNEVNFWSNYKDTIHGGFYNEVSNAGAFSPLAIKSFPAQSRLAYAFTRGFMLTGDVKYLNLARHALSFIYDHAWDTLHGGWYYSSNFDGSKPLNNMYHIGKWSYTQHYALLGCVAMNEATDGTYLFADKQAKDKTWMYKGLNEINTKLWDNREGVEGYYDLANQDWTSPHDKGFTPTADAMTTHAAVMAMRNIDSSYKARFLTLVDRITDKIIPPAYNSTSPLIYEFSDSEWVSYGLELFNGHAVKCAWQLGRAYMLEPKEIYKTKAQQVLNEVLARGYYDSIYGGIYYFKKEGQKNAWTQEQAILAGILNSTITEDPILKNKYLGLADNCMKFVETHMIDFTNGGSFTDVNTDGSRSTYPKGDYWEAGYHMSELAYYVYLYGNVYLYNKPVELYYHFSPQDSSQSHKLTPFEIADNKLMIEQVLLNDQPYTNFNAVTRTIEIPAGEGGKFKVRFGQNATVTNLFANSKAEEDDLTVYPMPVKSGFITIEGRQLTKGNTISIKIIDMTSRVVFERPYGSSSSLTIPVTQLKPGVYFLYVNDKVKKIVVGE